MIKILFVCHGNICRSPMAEFVMKKLVDDLGLSNSFEIESAATSCEELGNPVYPPARRKLAEHGIDCKGKFARRITEKDCEHFDYIILMDKNNLRNFGRMFGTEYDSKVSLLTSYFGSDRDVADPWYTGDFEETWNDIYNGCSKLLDYIKV